MTINNDLDAEVITIDLGDRSYPIYIGQGLLGPALLGNTEYLDRHFRNQQVLLVSNETVAPLYLKQVVAQLGNRLVETVVLPDGEQHKNLQILEKIFDGLLEASFGRDCTVVALGGGVIGDMAGFAAASYQRGVDFVQIPTSLLAQVDSSVGGKTGVNHALGKNMIGAFHQPNGVIIDTDVLASLPDNELSAGLAEVIKYGFIHDAAFFEWLEQNMGRLRARETSALTYAIRRSCEIKAEIVAADEREHGLRAILNLGHTFGHAIESAQGYGNWLHGEAVAAGISMALDLSRRLGWIGDNDVERGRRLIENAGLPQSPPATMDTATFLQYMQRDKKVKLGKLRLVLLQDIGHAVVSDDFEHSCLLATLGAFHPATNS